MTITGNFECFQYFNFETNFLKNENIFLKKLESSFVVNSTMIENITYPYKTDLSETNVKTNRNGEYKMDLSQRMQLCQYLLYFFENFVSA